MSQADDGTDLAELASAFEILNISVKLEIAATALFFYEYLLTFSDEVKCVWQRKTSIASVFFLVNRYVVFVNRLIRLVQVVSWQDYTEAQADKHNCSCNIMWRFSESATLLMYCAIAAFAALRMFAIWGSDIRIGACVVFLGLINPCVNIFYNTTLSFQAVPPPFTGCGQESRLQFSSADLLFFVFGSVFTIIFECVVLGLTAAKTADAQLLLKKMNPGAHPTTGYLLLRDGTIYFATLVVLNVLSLLSIRFQAFNNIPAMTDTLQSICVSRLFLNLRESRPPGYSTTTGHIMDPSDVRFATPQSGFLGNIGGSVLTHSDSENDDETEEQFLRGHTLYESTDP